MGRLSLLVLMAAAAPCAFVGVRDRAAADPPVPAEFQVHYDELSQELTSFEAQLDTQWDGSVGGGQLAGALIAANGNKTASLLTAATWSRIIELLDAYEAMGVRLIKLDVNYPLLTPAFHTYLAAHPPPSIPNYTLTVDNFIGAPNSFYNKLAGEIRSRGMGLWIETGTLFGDFSPTPADGYFADMRTAGLASTQTRLRAERSAEAALIVSQLNPDYFAIIDEPTTNNANFGYFPGQVPVLDADGWRAYVQQAAAAIAAAAPTAMTEIGAGSGVWEGTSYRDRFASLPELDFFDMHIYPLKSLTVDYLQTTLAWADYVHTVAPGKKVTIGEAWTWKTTAAEVSAGVNYEEAYSRDVYSFWEPIDVQFLDVLFKMMHDERMAGVMPFWAGYYFAYLTYGDPDLAGLSPLELLAAAGQAATQNIATMTLTGTGQEFASLIAVAPDADGDGVPDGADAGDSDGDGIADSADACPLCRTTWTVPAGDRDCDGIVDARESFAGTRPQDACANTAAANDEPLADAWPVDFDDNRVVTITDVSRYSAVFGSVAPGPPYAARYDLNSDGRVTITDVAQFSAFFGKSCSR